MLPETTGVKLDGASPSPEPAEIDSVRSKPEDGGSGPRYEKAAALSPKNAFEIEETGGL